jgi:hypothetical protein
LAIGSAVVVAACQIIVGGVEARARHTREMLEAARWELVQSKTNWSHEMIAKVRHEAALERSAIEARSSFGRDEAGLYAWLSELARRCSVQIDQVVPATQASVSPASSPSSDETGGSAPSKEVRATYTTTVVGSYGGIAQFVSGLEHESGFAAVRSLRLSPGESTASGLVRAVLVTEHFAMDLGGTNSEAAR